MVTNSAMSVLVVDDFKTMAGIVRKLLAQIGLENVDEAPDGASALARMREKKYQLVISDWNMAPMTGHELLKQIRADEALARTPFVMMTAEQSAAHVVEARKAGVDSFLIKPFNAATLKSKIDEALAA